MGSFNYDINKMIFQDEFIAAEDQIRSVLDYEIKIRKLSEKYQKYCALTGEIFLRFTYFVFDIVWGPRMSVNHETFIGQFSLYPLSTRCQSLDHDLQACIDPKVVRCESIDTA